MDKVRYIGQYQCYHIGADIVSAKQKQRGYIMVKFDATKFHTLSETTPRQRFKHEVEDILSHVRHLFTPRPHVGWIKCRPNILGVAVDLDRVGCMTLMSLVRFEKRTPYGDIDVAVYDDMTLREVIASWEENDGKASINAVYPGSIEAGCKQLGWISEPDDEEEWDSYI